MAEVKWIKLNVGMFDGNSFKRIKKAKIGGESFRDKLTAVWFELMDFAGKCNAGGQLIETPEIPFSSIDDIAVLIDREPEELNLCMQYYINNRMISVIDDVFMLTNWAKYQNEDGLERIREQNRLRQAKFKRQKKLLAQSNVTDNVIVTQGNATDIEEDKEKDKEIEIESIEQKRKRFVPPTLEEVKAYCLERKNNVDAERFIDYYTSNGWLVGKNKMKDWKAAVRTWERNGYSGQAPKTDSGSFDTDDFLNAALGKAKTPRAALEREAINRAAEKKAPKTAGEDEEIRNKMEELKKRLGQ